jgi:hypothetical protein
MWRPWVTAPRDGLAHPSSTWVAAAVDLAPEPAVLAQVLAVRVRARVDQVEHLALLALVPAVRRVVQAPQPGVPVVPVVLVQVPVPLLLRAPAPARLPLPAVPLPEQVVLRVAHPVPSLAAVALVVLVVRPPVPVARPPAAQVQLLLRLPRAMKTSRSGARPTS